MLRTRRTGHRRDERGAAVVEFALVMPLLFTILFGMITTGLAFSDHLSATNATREASRYGAAADITDANWANNVETRLIDTYFNAGEEEPPAAQVCVQLVQGGATPTVFTENTGASCGTRPDLPDNMAAGSCAVVVWMQKPREIQLIVSSPEVNIWAGSVSYYQREATPTCTAP